MTLHDKTKKLLEYSVILKGEDKKSWLETLPKMSEQQAKTLYDVLVDEVKAWKKEGISIIPDLAVEMQLLPEVEHGTSINDLKARIGGKAPVQPPKASPPTRKATTTFGKELEREVNTPELPAGQQESGKPVEATKPEPEPVFGEIKPDLPNPDKNAWMLSNKVVVPKAPLGVIKPKPLGVPRVRNRVAKSGLTDLASVRTVNDLKKIEPAHLRQGPLKEQILFIKQKIAQLARENDILPISIIPVFEQSHLFQTYLQAGAMLIDKNMGEDKVVLEQIMDEIEAMGMDSLTQEEFEAVADLKKELEGMAGL